MLEAKDTVMSEESLEEVKYLEMKDNPEYRFELPAKMARKIQDKAIATSQAEISFKAGIREVIEDLQRRLAPHYMATLKPGEFEATGDWFLSNEALNALKEKFK